LKISPAYQKIYDVVAKIPPGKVATYGQVADLAGMKGHARLVGYALHNLPHNSILPWHRVINNLGKISYAISRNAYDNLQRRLLEAEGILFDHEGKIDLMRYRWIE
jgi:methylated-DNA-protein-cysteine methyltransferase-like protein